MPEFSDEAEAAAQAKVRLRAAVLASRRVLSARDRVTAAVRVHDELAHLVRRMRPAQVSAYVPIGTEPGGVELPDVLLAALPAGASLLLPVLRPDLDLDWAIYGGPGSLVVAGRGMREPTGERLGPGAVGAVDLVVVPALAVDERGSRLGRGGGSYDRALARVGTGVLTVALLHDGELVAGLPAQEHDRPVRAVITPSGGLRVLAPD